MMHTEEQAREIRCCGPEGCGQNRAVELTAEEAEDLKALPSHGIMRHEGKPIALRRFCIASKCMAWRWITGFLERDDVSGEPIRGYCGLCENPNPLIAYDKDGSVRRV